MAKKISNENFISSDFGQPAIDALKEILVLTDDLIGTLKKVGKESEGALEGLNPKESVKDSNKLNEVLEKLLKTQEDLSKLQDDKRKITADIKRLEEQKLKQDKEALAVAVKTNKVKQEEQKTLLAEQKVVAQNQKIAVARRKERERQFKAREKERKQRSKILTEYQKESRRLNELRNRYKDLAVAEKENTDEAKALLKEVTKLDKKLKEIDETVGQNQRSVGNYERALEGLNGTIAKFGIVAGITAAFEFLGEAFGNTREGALGLQIFFSKFSETAKVFVSNIVEAAKSLPSVFSAIGDSIQSTFASATIKFLELERTLQKGLAFAGVSGADEEVKRLDDEIKALEATILKLDESKVSDGIDKIKKAFEGTVDTTSRAIQEQEKFLRLQLQLRISISEQEKALAGLAEQRQILQDISDDDTLSFIEREKFITKARDAAVEFAKLDNKLALDKEKLTIEAVKQDLRRANALSETRLQQITTGEQLQKELENEAIAKKVSDANDEAFSAAFIERVDKQVEAEAFARDQEEKNRKTRRDDFEQELDIIEELGEQRIAQNQKIIADETKTIEQRQAALEKNNAIEDKIFNEGLDRIRKQGKASIDLRKDLSDLEKEERKALIDNADIQKILNSESETEQLNLIKTIELGEIETQRLKDLLKIKQDVSAQNAADAKALKEERRETDELKEEVQLQRDVLDSRADANKENIDLEKERTEDQKKNLQDRIDLLTKDSKKRLELERELNNILLEESQERLDEETEATEKAAEKRADAIQKAAQLATEFIEKQNEKRLKAIDDTLTGIEERQSSLRAAAEQGNEQAVKSLAESEKKEAEVRQERERELQRQQRIEAGLAAFQVFAANAAEDPNTALTKTLTDITTLTAFLGSLPSFFVGTEDTGKANNALDSNGGRLSILHDNERVITAEQNKQIGKLSNEELTRLAVDHKRGTFKQFEQVAPVNSPVLVQNHHESLKAEMNELIRAVKDNKQNTVLGFDKRTNVYTEIVTKAGKIESNRKQLFPIRKSKKS